MKNVVLLSTRRLPPAYFDTVREDLGDADITLDVVGWVAPAGPVADKVHTFTLIGPGPHAGSTCSRAGRRSHRRSSGRRHRTRGRRGAGSCRW